MRWVALCLTSSFSTRRFRTLRTALVPHLESHPRPSLEPRPTPSPGYNEASRRAPQRALVLLGEPKGVVDAFVGATTSAGIRSLSRACSTESPHYLLWVCPLLPLPVPSLPWRGRVSVSSGALGSRRVVTRFAGLSHPCACPRPHHSPENTDPAGTLPLSREPARISRVRRLPGSCGRLPACLYPRQPPSTQRQSPTLHQPTSPSSTSTASAPEWLGSSRCSAFLSPIGGRRPCACASPRPDAVDSLPRRVPPHAASFGRGVPRRQRSPRESEESLGIAPGFTCGGATKYLPTPATSSDGTDGADGTDDEYGV